MPKTIKKKIENSIEKIVNGNTKIEAGKNQIERNRQSLSVNAILNILKQCCSILFPLISYPYVTRVLGSAGLGRYSFADSVVQYFVLLASLGIPTYAVREGARVRNDAEKIRNLSAELFTLSLISGCVSCLVLLLLTFMVPKLRAEEVLLLILGVRVITTVLGRDWINTIYEDFLYITARYIALQVLALLMIFLLVKDAGDYVLYTAIMLISTAGADVLNIFYTKRYVPMRLAKVHDIRRHLRPVLYLFSTTIAINIYIHSDVTILGFLRSVSACRVYHVCAWRGRISYGRDDTSDFMHCAVLCGFRLLLCAGCAGAEPGGEILLSYYGSVCHNKYCTQFPTHSIIWHEWRGNYDSACGNVCDVSLLVSRAADQGDVNLVFKR